MNEKLEMADQFIDLIDDYSYKIIQKYDVDDEVFLAVLEYKDFVVHTFIELFSKYIIWEGGKENEIK